MDVVAVLAQVGEGERAAGVVLDREGDVWLVGSLSSSYGTALEGYRPCEAGLDGDRTLIGGRLPAGAASAEIVEHGRHLDCVVGSGTWVTVLDGETAIGLAIPVLYRDRSGAVLNPGSIPPDWPREAVLDSDVRCPACAATAWDVVTPVTEGAGATRSTRWGNDSAGPRRGLVCRVCGHEELMGVFYGPTADHPAEPLGEAPEREALRRPESEEARQLAHRLVLDTVEFPVYMQSGHAGRMTSHSTSDDLTRSVTITHGPIEPDPGPRLKVTSEPDDVLMMRTEHQLAREALANALSPSIPEIDGQSDGALVLSLRAARRGSRAAAAAAERGGVEIYVDGAWVRFELLAVGSRWAAVAHLDASVVTLDARGVDPQSIRLTAAVDPHAQLL